MRQIEQEGHLIYFYMYVNKRGRATLAWRAPLQMKPVLIACRALPLRNVSPALHFDIPVLV